MSIQFNDTTTKKGLVQLYEREIGADYGYISGNEERLKGFTADVNVAFDDFCSIALQAAGTQQFDDVNHTKLAIVMANLVNGQRDYVLTNDEQGNEILEIFKIAILPSATATEYIEITPFDEVNDRGNAIVSNSSVTGTPTRYGRISNGIFLDPPTGYSVLGGLRAFVSREPFYFVYTDTTRKPGVPGILHEWFYKKPAWEDAKRKILANESSLAKDVMVLESKIAAFFSLREKDIRRRLTVSRDSNR